MEEAEYKTFEERFPLAKFSFYLNCRVSGLLDMGRDIKYSLEKAYDSESVLDAEAIGRAEWLMWLWVLGAYEVIRTMSQAKKCFKPNLVVTLNELKADLGVVRMPAAKMEKKGKRLPVTSSRSPAGLDAFRKDLLIGDPDDERSCRQLLDRFHAFFTSIEPEDIVCRHEESY